MTIFFWGGRGQTAKKVFLVHKNILFTFFQIKIILAKFNGFQCSQLKKGVLNLTVIKILLKSILTTTANTILLSKKSLLTIEVKCTACSHPSVKV